MSTVARTIVATGCSSGLGFEAIKQLLGQSQPQNLILGARDTARTAKAFDEVKYDASRHKISILPLQLSDLKSVKAFAKQTLAELDQTPIDCVLLNAATSLGTQKKSEGDGKSPWTSKWSEAHITNHLSQHYLIHLLRDKLVSSKSRIVFVSSGAIRSVKDTSTVLSDMRELSGQSAMEMYPKSKFVALLGAHYWRRQLLQTNTVIAVSPGLIPGTGLGRGSGQEIPKGLPDAKTVPEGAQNVLRAVDIEDVPENPQQIFLTSWGEWWPTEQFALTLDEKLQDEACPSLETIEKEEDVSS